MGKKKSRSEEKYDASPAEPESEESSSFAERLLSSMNISSKEDKASDLDEEAVDTSEAASDAPSEGGSESEIKHPHLHQIHKSISRVFRKDSSSKDGSQRSSSSLSRAGSGSANDPESRSKAAETATTISEEGDDAGEDTEESPEQAGAAPGKKKRNRRKEKLAERERERARVVQEAQAEAKSVPDKRAIELKGMGMMITKAGLVEHEVQPDGHCLFHSLSDQLKQRHGVEVSADEMRSELANYIRSHPDDFVPYLVEDETGDVISVEKYTDDLENTPLWGGELEIMAASRKYEVPVRVFFASQAPLTVNEEQFTDSEPLTIAYYQAKFGLGAHYNSLRDAPKSGDAPKPGDAPGSDDAPNSGNAPESE